VCAFCSGKPGNVQFIREPKCRRCGLPYQGDIEGSFACGNCRDSDLQFNSASAAVMATEFMLDIVHRYKYRHALWFEPLFVPAACSALRTRGWDGIVPVPLHPARQREREFNQAERLARHLSAESGIPLRTDIVRRTRPTRVQASLDRRERARNVAGVFEIVPDRRLNGGRFVIVDDVLTTGATTSAVSAVLRSAGATEIVVWTLARGI
jgi:competence protein ComFC